MSSTLCLPAAAAIDRPFNTTHRSTVVEGGIVRHQHAAALFDLPNVEIWNGSDGTPEFFLKLNFPRILERIARHGRGLPRVVEAIAYGRFGHVSFGREEYLKRRAGIDVKLSHKDCDPMIHADAVRFADNGFRVVVFVGSDIDVTHFVDILHSRNVRVEVWGWKNKTSDKLRGEVDEFVELTPDLIIKQTAWRNYQPRPAA